MTMNTYVYKHAKQSALLLFVLCALLSCGGEQIAPSADSPNIDPESPSQSSDSALKPVFSMMGETLNEDNWASYQDQDNDGLPDAIDDDPLTPLRPVSGEGALVIASIASVLGQAPQSNVVVSGAAIEGKLLNSHRYSAPFYLLWHSAEGIHAQQISVDTYGEFSVVLDELLPTGVSVASLGHESAALKVQAFGAKEPLIFMPSAPIYAGQQVRFEGQHLETITQLEIGGKTVDFTVEGNTIAAQLPLSLHSNVLRWERHQASKQRQDLPQSSLVLPLMRKIQLRTDPSIVKAQQWSALSEQGKIILPPANAGVMAMVTISLPVNNKPSYLRFYHPVNRSVEAVVWPHSTHITLGIQSTLESHIVRRLALDSQAQQQVQIQQAIDALMSHPGGQASLARLESLHAQAFALEREADLQAETERLISELGAQRSSLDSNTREFSRAALSSNSSVSSGSNSLFDYLDDTFAAIFASNVMYEPISKIVDLPSRHGANDYSGMSVSFYRDASTCVGLESLNTPAGIWPSDLCARNEGVYFASLQVTNALTNKVLKSHVKEYLDTGMIGASGWGLLSLDPIAYITTDGGSPLCHMQVCRLEFLTGGLGLDTNVSLTKAQQKAQNIVLGRTMLERVVLPIVGSLLGQANVDGAIGKCLATHIAVNAPTSLVSYGTMIAEFKKKIDSASSEAEIENIVKETVAKYAYDVAGGMLAKSELPKCIPAGLRDDFFASLKDKVSDFAEKAAVPIRVASAATVAFQGFQAIYTPEKFTFEVAPRAAITRISTSNSSLDEAIPELFSTMASNKLFIRGTKFVYLQDDGDNYWPKLLLKDRFGNSQTLQLNESHKVDISDLSWVDIAISVSDLAPLMKKLRGDIINVSIVMDDADYSDFSSAGLPLPGRDIRWVGQAKMFKATPQNARAGRLITLRGENLQSFAARYDLKLTLIQANDASKTGEVFKVESASADKIKFRLPSSLPLNLYKLRLDTSDPNVSLDVPDDILSGSLTGATNVLPQTASLVELYDSGAKIDDAIIIYIANADGDIISQNNDFLRLELLENNPLPAVSMWWKNENLSAQNNGSTTAGQILVTCDSGGTDQICTYRVKGEINVDGTFKAINFRGKLQSGEDAAHSF